MKRACLYKKVLLAGLVMFAAWQGVCCKGGAADGKGVADKGKGGAAGIAEKDVFTCTSGGRWYPGSPGKLRAMVDGFLAKAEKKELPGRVAAVMAPHAGFAYSGPVAGFAYRQLEGLRFDTVVAVGFNHRVRPGEGLAIYPGGGFRTPLGVIPVDVKTAAELMKASGLIKSNAAAFSGEHSLDNQLPFLQRALGDFRLVPILMSEQTPENIDALAGALAKVLKGKNALIVASSDMSHFWTHDEAAGLDKAVMDKVLELDAEGLARLLADDPSGRRLCGRGVVEAVMRAAVSLGADKAELLKYADSEDTSGPTGNGVVGYGAVAFTDSKRKNKVADGKPPRESVKPVVYGGELDAEDQARLLQIAREAITGYVRDGKAKEFTNGRARLDVKRGVFVTVNENGELRGCMGHFEADTPLFEIVARQAVVAATQDPRFMPLSADELGRIKIEISVLSEPRAVASYKDIEVGTHGVILRKGMAGATFLPQVAPDEGWGLEEMLSNLSRKAGLAADAWKGEGVAFEVYTAQVFGEE